MDRRDLCLQVLAAFLIPCFAGALAPPELSLVNPSFEEDFENGLASGWTLARTANYGGTLRKGSEYTSNGSRSQRFEMPEPSGGEARLAVSQRLGPVTPGAVYTFECDVRLEMTGETYEGEDLVFQIGIDAFGKEPGDFSSTIWSSMIGKKKEWVHVEYSAEARSTSITVYFCAVRKFPHHGDDAVLWLDNTHVAGPPSLDTPTPFPTLTPTPTAPNNLGTERLENGDFEDGFTRGVGNGWKSFNTAGGLFSENPKLGRIGGGIYGARKWDDKAKDWNEDIQTIRLSGKVHLVDESRFDVVSKLQKEFGEDVITVAKLGPEPWASRQGINLLQGNIEGHARAFANYCYNKSQKEGHWPHCYYGLNEPSVNELDDIRRVARFEKAFAERLHEWGLRACVLNNSTGTPAPAEYMLLDEVRELLAVADYAGYHCYGSPDGFFMCHPESLESHSLRWRQFARWYQERGWRFPPVIYTEGTTWWGWHDNHSPAKIRDDLLCFERHIAEDRWALGLCIFCTGVFPGQTWIDWDVSPYPEIIEAARERNLQHPVDAHSGTAAQRISQSRAGLDAGIVQGVSTETGKDYWLSGWMKYEFSGGWPHEVSIRVGFDPTAQTKDPLARTVQWSADLVSTRRWESDIWYRYGGRVKASGKQVSIWVRAVQRESEPRVRVYVDDMEFREIMK